jgi:hypothetical protein
MINITLGDRLYAVTYGLFNRSPNPQVRSIKYLAGGQDNPIINIEPIFSWDRPYCFLEKPIVVSPATNLTVRCFPEGVATPYERIGLLGFASAKRTYLIQQ